MWILILLRNAEGGGQGDQIESLCAALSLLVQTGFNSFQLCLCKGWEAEMVRGLLLGFLRGARAWRIKVEKKIIELKNE